NSGSCWNYASRDTRWPRSPGRRAAPSAPSSGTFRKYEPGCVPSSTGRPMMIPSRPDSVSRSLDDFVAAFEEALYRDDPVDIGDFLPSSDHPLHDSVLSELIRVELEHDWEHGHPRPLAEYRRLFPDFFRNPDNLQAIAFEEYRLRRQAGQSASPEEYERAYGVC